MSKPNPARVATMYQSRTAAVSPLMQVLKPVYKGDPEDFEDFVEDVQATVWHELKPEVLAFSALRTYSVVAVGSKQEKAGSFYHESGMGRTTYYHAKIEYPATVVVQGEQSFDVGHHWKEYFTQRRFDVPALTEGVLEVFSEDLKEALALETSNAYLIPEEYETAEEWLYSHPTKGIHTDASSSRVDADGEEDEDEETWSVQAHIRYEVDTGRVKLDVQAQASSGQLVVKRRVPIKVLVDRVISPWSHEYRGF